MKATIIGGTGFIGRKLAAYLAASGYECSIPCNGDTQYFNESHELIFYCAGVTSDFRTRPFATVESHVTLLKEILAKVSFNKLIYLSSTRVYGSSENTTECASIYVNPLVPDDIYNISKLMGESIIIACKRNASIARVSNVIGPKMNKDSFIGSLLVAAVENNVIRLETGIGSSKDYIWIEDVVRGLRLIAEKGKSSIYNLASGTNITNFEIYRLFQSVGVDVEVCQNGQEVIFQPISTVLAEKEIGFKAVSCMPKLRKLISDEIRNLRYNV